jgi:hypothetical protein
MTTMHQRLVRLQEATAHGAPIEQTLLTEDVRAKSELQTNHPGVSRTHLVVLESGQAIFKPFEGQDPNACHHYGQTAIEAPVHEVVAWRLAHAMGEPWSQLVPAAVLRNIPDLNGGALLNYRAGGPNPEVFDRAPGQVYAAAFWDALIGQQDRHATNFRYDPVENRLATIDNAFAFAVPGALCPNALFLAWRRSDGGTMLRSGELEALEALLGSDLHGLRDYLAPERADALEARAQGMLERHCLPLPGVF